MQDDNRQSLEVRLTLIKKGHFDRQIDVGEQQTSSLQQEKAYCPMQISLCSSGLQRHSHRTGLLYAPHLPSPLPPVLRLRFRRARLCGARRLGRSTAVDPASLLAEPSSAHLPSSPPSAEPRGRGGVASREEGGRQRERGARGG
jgi:hypothetical protein